MPTYQYRCTACGEPLEVVQSFTDDPLTECPDCGGELRKVFSSVGIVFKGSGFYRTDSRSSSDKQSAAAGSGSSSESKSEKKADTKSDTKSAKSESTSDSTSSGSSEKKSDGGSSTTKTSAA